MDTTAIDLNEYCSSNERDYSDDKEVRMILLGGPAPAPVSMLRAAHAIRRKEGSAFLKLPVENLRDTSTVNSVPEIGQIPGLVFKYFKIAAGCPLTGDEPVMIRVPGPFSAFMTAAGTNATYRWMQKHGPEVKEAFAQIMDGLSEYCIEMAGRGARILSIADPSAIADVLGEKKYREFAAEYTVRLVRQILPHAGNSILHLCPRTSLLLEGYGYCRSRKLPVQSSDYASALLNVHNVTKDRLIGHRCINAEKACCTFLTLLELV